MLKLNCVVASYSKDYRKKYKAHASDALLAKNRLRTSQQFFELFRISSNFPLFFALSSLHNTVSIKMATGRCKKCDLWSHKHPAIDVWLCRCTREYIHPEADGITGGQKRGGIITVRHGEDNRWEETMLLSENLRARKDELQYAKGCAIYRMYKDQSAIWEKYVENDDDFKEWDKFRWLNTVRIIKNGSLRWIKTRLARTSRTKETAQAVQNQITKASVRGAEKMGDAWANDIGRAQIFDHMMLGNKTQRVRSKRIHTAANAGVSCFGVPVPKLPSAQSVDDFIKDIGEPLEMR